MGKEAAVWCRSVIGAGGRPISLAGIRQFIREADVTRCTGDERALLREAIQRKLHHVCGGPPVLLAVPRRHGLTAWRDWCKDGTLVVAHLPHRVMKVGNEARVIEVVEMDAALAKEEADEMGFPFEPEDCF